MNSIGTILFSEAIKATMILLAAYAATFALRRASASARRFVWIIAATCLLALPVLSLLLPPLGIARNWSEPARALATPLRPDTVITVSATAAPLSAASRPMPWILIVWTAGVLAVLGRWAAGTARMWWLTRTSSHISPPEGAHGLEARIGAGRVRYLESSRAAMPMTWGILRPSILLPANRAAWPAERLRLVLAHELIHVRQRDCLMQLLMQIACALYWFHPLAWLAAAQFRKERERACDDGVLNLGINGPEYAGHLLELVRSLKPGSRPALAVAMAQSHLESRLVALLDAKVNRKMLTRKAASVAALAAACVIFPLAAVRAQAQAGTGSLRGVVYDASGAVIPGARVMATNLDGQNKEEAISGAAGQFTLKSIPSGHYLLEVSVPGFRVFQRRNVVLNANESPRLDVVMEIGTMNESMVVTAQKPSGQPAPAGIPHRIRVGGNVSAAKLLTKVVPVYPEYAKEKGIEGSVLLQAVISKEGSVLSLSVLNTADSDLAQAARNAVEQWHYQPTLLNGQPVEVVTTITVDFQLKP